MGPFAMLFTKNAGPVVRRLACLASRRRGVRPGTAGAAVSFCAAAVVLAGCFGSLAAAQARAGGSTPVTGSSQSGSSAWRTENSGTRHRLYDVACLSDGISCPSPAACYAVGDNGTILARR